VRVSLPTIERRLRLRRHEGMRRHGHGARLIGPGILVVMLVAPSGGPAHAAEGPLLVVVEAPPALDADAAEIRRAIGVELRAPTIAPMKTTDEPTGRALIVALDHERIAMSLRTNDAAPVARVIPAPAEHAARLRAIAWLAGNLARDQVSSLLTEMPFEMPSLATLPPTPAAPRATEPPQVLVASQTVEPPPLADSTTTISMSAPNARPAGPRRWSILVTDGPTTNFPICPGIEKGSGAGLAFCAPFLEYGTAWRLEVQHRSESNGFFTGAALSGTASAGSGSFAPQLIGGTAFLGSSHHVGRWTFELTGGVGLELARVSNTVLTSMYSSTNGFTSTQTTSSNNATPGLFADGTAALTHPVSDSLDVVLRLGAHLTTVTYGNWFLSTTIGLRYNLP
jgi:hypothetical protein